MGHMMGQCELMPIRHAHNLCCQPLAEEMRRRHPTAEVYEDEKVAAWWPGCPLEGSELGSTVATNTREYRPDIVVKNDARQTIWIVEVTRRRIWHEEHNEESDLQGLRRCSLQKRQAYGGLHTLLKGSSAYCKYEIKVLAFVIGLCGEIDERLWISNLRTMGVPSKGILTVIKSVIRAHVDGCDAIINAYYAKKYQWQKEEKTAQRIKDNVTQLNAFRDKVSWQGVAGGNRAQG